MIDTFVQVIFLTISILSVLFGLRMFALSKRNSRKLIDLEFKQKEEKVKNEVQKADLQSLVDTIHARYSDSESKDKAGDS